ncbi:MAG: hypothetical protein LRZ99_03515 [Desulfotomaculum sp.]|nr:hypothetical protein [Desulfotomaculum sp.]
MKKEFDFFDRPKVQKALSGIFVGAFLGLLVLNFFFPKKAYFVWDAWPAFYALFGIIGCVLLVIIAKGIRYIVKKKEDYYG